MIQNEFTLKGSVEETRCTLFSLHLYIDIFVSKSCFSATLNPPVHTGLMSCERATPQAIMVSFSMQGIEENYVLKLYSFVIY